MPGEFAGLHAGCGGAVTHRSWTEQLPYGMDFAGEPWAAYDCERCGEVGADDVLAPGQETYCDCCGRPFRENGHDRLCGGCRAKPGAATGHRAA